MNSPELGIRNTNYGVLPTDRTHVVNLGYSIQLPDVKQGGLMQAILGGWQLSGVTTFISGAALHAAEPNFNITGTARRRQHHQQHPDHGIAGHRAPCPIIHVQSRARAFPAGTCSTPAASGRPCPAHNGNYVSPTVRGPWYQNHNLSVFKNFSLGSGPPEAAVPDGGLQLPQPSAEPCWIRTTT